MAGESADEVARRSRVKADRLLRHAEMFEKGAQGERIAADLLTRLPPDWFVLHDVAWPGRARANIDHVVVGPTGIYVIDAKNWSGSVTISRGVLRQNGYNRTTAVSAARAAAQAVAEQVPAINPELVRPVICFVGPAQTTGEIGGVLISSARTLHATLLAPRPTLSASALQSLRLDLETSSVPATGPRTNVTPLVGMPSLPPTGTPAGQSYLRAAAARRTIGSNRGTRSRKPSKLRLILGAFLLWLLFSEALYLALNPIAHQDAAVFGPAYLVAAAAALTISLSRFKKARAARR